MDETTSKDVGLLPQNDRVQKKLTTMMSVYALDAHEKWVQLSMAYPVFLTAYTGLMIICLFANVDEVLVMRIYSALAVAGLLYRVRYYLRRRWILYFIDLCFMGTIVLIITLAMCHFETCSQYWLRAVYIICTGPIPGSTFMLQLPLTFHHPEAFESFFLHATPMWLSYCRRWKWNVFNVDPMPSIGELVWDGMVDFYIPWVLPYIIFLLIQPFLPCTLASYQTLMDLFVEEEGIAGEQRLMHKKENYVPYYTKIMGFTIGHAVLSASGALAGALSFQSWHANVLWIVGVQIQGMISGYYFYAKSAGINVQKPAFIVGFMRMGVAWLFMVPTWYYSINYLTSPTISGNTTSTN